MIVLDGSGKLRSLPSFLRRSHSLLALTVGATSAMSDHCVLHTQTPVCVISAWVQQS